MAKPDIILTAPDTLLVRNKLRKSIALGILAVIGYVVYRGYINIFFVATGVTEPRFYLYLAVLYMIYLSLLYSGLSLINLINSVVRNRVITIEIANVIGAALLGLAIYIFHVVVFIPVVIEQQGLSALNTAGTWPMLFIVVSLATGLMLLYLNRESLNAT